MDRRTFIAGIAAMGVGSVTSPWLHNRAQIGVSDIARVRKAAKEVQALDFAHGGGAALHQATADLRQMSAWLDVVPDWLRPKLGGAVGELAQATGFAAFDAGHYDTARQTWSLAMQCAEQADDWALWAHVVCNAARQEAWFGRPEVAMPMITNVLDQSRQLPPTLTAMAHGVRSRVLATMGDVEGTLVAVGAGDDALDLADPSGDPVSVGYYDRATHLGNTGHALADLVSAGHPEVAKHAGARIMGSISEQRSARSIVMGQVVGATVVMQAGDPAEAVAVADAALPLAGQVDSDRARKLLWRLHDAASQHADRADVAHLRHRIAQHAA